MSRFKALWCVLLLSGCLTTGPDADQLEQARQISYAFVREQMGTPDLGMPDLVVTSDMSIEVPFYIPKGYAIREYYNHQTRTLYISTEWKNNAYWWSILVHGHVHYFQHAMGKRTYCREFWEQEAVRIQLEFMKVATGYEHPAEEMGILEVKGCD